MRLLSVLPLTLPPLLYPLSLHDALPISGGALVSAAAQQRPAPAGAVRFRPADAADVPRIVEVVEAAYRGRGGWRSEEHTSELQSRENLVCRLLLEKKKNREKNELAPRQ